MARKKGDVARNSTRNRTVHGATEGWRVARNVTLLVLVALRLVRGGGRCSRSTAEGDERGSAVEVRPGLVLGPIRVSDS